MSVGPRTTSQIIDQAIAENRLPEVLCYVLICLFVAVGVGALIWGAVQGEGIVALAGAVGASLFWPALSNLRQIRQQNMTIRLLEVPLSRAGNAKAAAEALREVFLASFGRGGKP